MSDLQGLYYRLPIWAQELSLSVYARRLDRLYYGQRFHYWMARYTESERLPAADLRELQLERLNEILAVANQHVPWFRGKTPSVNKLEELAHFPIMEKDPIRHDPWQFVRDDIDPKELWLEKTSGTTGTALRIYWSREMLARWWALQEARVRKFAGVCQRLPRAMVGGRPIVHGATRRPPFWRYNRHWQQLYCSSYHISPATAPHYIDALRRYDCRWITGYGSAIALLAEYLRDHPTPLAIQAAVTSGDTVSPAQRSIIEDGFRCRLYDNYGSAEGCVVAAECKYGRMHVQPEIGILEIVNARGEPAPAGEDGEFICTGLGNDAMPLIRYRTGDYGSWAHEQKCPCGRQTPILDHVTGRTDDYLLLADGRRIGRLSTAMKKAPSVRMAQLAQDALDHAWLLLVPEEHYRDRDGDALVDDILSRIGNGSIRIDVRLVAEIPPTPVGKHILVRRIMDDHDLQARYNRLIARGVERKVAV